ncbi:hypothetical protein B7463_g459, partial [Scytalidium lignicola]
MHGTMNSEQKSPAPAVSFLGPVSSYTHQSGEVARGVVPFENSTNGAVIFTLELLADRSSLFPDIYVCGEAYLDVQHYLLGHRATETASTDSADLSGTATPTSSIPIPLKSRSRPLSCLKHIQRIYTHPQAFGQCEAFLGAYLKGIERIDVSSTSKAAELVKQDKTGTSVAIASKLAAEIHELDILAESIEDRDDNTTRFFILRKEIDDVRNHTAAPTKSLVSFTIDHGVPGALADVLGLVHTPTLSRVSSTRRHLHAQELTSRPPNITYDYLSPTPSHLLNITLRDFLPQSCDPPNFKRTNIELPPTGTSQLAQKHALPQGHHLVYFSPQIPENDLLPDGTDLLQSPGPPFMRRMWAGGSVLFDTSKPNQLHLDNVRAACVERIRDVTVKGSEGDEKIFVSIERRYMPVNDSTGEAAQENIDAQGMTGTASIVELRDLVFLREEPDPLAKMNAAKSVKLLKPRHTPDFSISMIPSQSLLFRFSALTFNAHRIHLDPQYCQEVEGYRNLLLHGPLSLVLLLSVLRSQLRDGEMVKRFDYRNLAPLYAHESLTVCVLRNSKENNKYEVWIEGNGGGYAVKGTAVTE